MQNGVLLILISMALTPFGDGLSKQLGATQDPVFIAFLRYFIAGLMALAIAAATKTKIVIPRGDWLGMIFRTGLVMGAMTLLIVALSMVPLASAVGGFLIAPIVATLLAIAVLGERLTAPKLVGSVISFFGALLILRPSAGLDLGTVYALLGGALLGAYLATTRGASSVSNPVSTLAVQCLLGAAMLAPLAFRTPPEFSTTLLPSALGLGAVTAATHFLTVAAYARAEASTLSPFLYFNLVAAVTVGYFWFGEVPQTLTLTGLVAIALGGWITLIVLPSIPPAQIFLRSRRYAN